MSDEKKMKFIECPTCRGSGEEECPHCGELMGCEECEETGRIKVPDGGTEAA